MPTESTTKILKELEKSLPKLTLDGKTYYMAEWDLLLDETRLIAYALELAARATMEVSGAPPPDRLLSQANQAGQPKRWKKGLVLTYAVLRDTFADHNQYEAIKDNMLMATADWEGACGVN